MGQHRDKEEQGGALSGGVQTQTSESADVSSWGMVTSGPWCSVRPWYLKCPLLPPSGDDLSHFWGNHRKESA